MLMEMKNFEYNKHKTHYLPWRRALHPAADPGRGTDPCLASPGHVAPEYGVRQLELTQTGLNRRKKNEQSRN